MLFFSGFRYVSKYITINPKGFMKKTSLILLLTLLASTAQAQDETLSHTAPEITVTGQKGDLLRQITGEGSTLLNPSQMSVYKTINLLPSLNQQSVDPYGLADIVSYHEAFRFRGVEATSGGVPGTTVNVEGVPVTGRPGGGATIYDLENFRNINIFTGVMSANRGLGLMDIGGKIDMEIRRPEERYGIMFKQGVGSDSFRRTFVRVDTGDLGSGIRSFVSASTSFADKWKGYGSSNRNNSMFGITAPLGENVKLETFVTYSKGNISAYKPFTYAQLGTLDIYAADYSTSPASSDYSGYNRNEFEDWMVMANLEVKTGNRSKLNIKPYFWNDKGYYLESITSPITGIRRWDIDHNLKGVLAEYDSKIGNAEFDFGYLYHTQERPGPPSSQKLYTVSADGSLGFDRWYILSNPSNHKLHTAFTEMKYQSGDWRLEGGIKYVHYRLPEILTYSTTGIGDINYDTALASATLDSFKSASNAKGFSRLFPDLTMTRSVGDNTTLHLSYGENYVTQVDIYPYYIAQSSLNASIPFQRFWDERKMETAQTFEFGMKLKGTNWSMAPTTYYTIHQNKQAVLFDSALNATYPMNNADAEGYGAELEAEARPRENLKCYGSLSWNRVHFTQDLRSDAPGNPNIPVKGNQVPDAPEFMAKGMLSWRVGEFTVSPIARYTSVRYGDVQHAYRIDGATVFDLDLTWSRSIPGLNKVDCSLSFLNLFDKHYVSMISSSDYKTLQSTYYPGAPFTVVASFAVHY